MTRQRIASVIVLMSAVTGLWGFRVILPDVQEAQAATPPSPIDIMQIMREAKDLPEQAYNAI